MKGRSVLIVEDEPIVAEDIRESLEEVGFRVVGVAYDSEDALDLLGKHSIDIALLDITLSRPMEGIELAHQINKKHSMPFVFLTALSDQSTLEAVRETLAMGYLVKPFRPAELHTALELALSNYYRQQEAEPLSRDTLNKSLVEPVSKREWEVLQLLLAGKSNQEIASELFVSINTVKTHLSRLYAKMEVDSRAQVLAYVNSLV